MSRTIILSVLTVALAQSAALTARAQDRYGPGQPATAPSSAALGDTARAAGSARPHLLSWPGKHVATTSAAPPAGGAPARGVAATPAYKTLSTYRAAPVRLDSSWAPIRPQPARVQRAVGPILAGTPQAGVVPQAEVSQAAPTSIYAPAPPRQVASAASQSTPASTSASNAAPNPAVAGTGDQPVRFYSLHRQYGLQPDPAPLPAQFFAGAASDLSQPPGPIPSQRLTTGSGAAVVTRTVRGADGSDPTPDTTSGQQ